MLRRRPTRTLRNPRRLHEGWGNVSYNNIKMKQVKHLKVAVVETTDWDYNPIEDDGIYDAIGIVSLDSRESTLENGDIKYRDIEDFDTLKEVVDYIKEEANCTKVYAIETYEHGLVAYKVIDIGSNLSDRWDSRVDYLVYSPNDEVSKSTIESLIEGEITDWANGSNMYWLQLFDVESDKLEDAINSGFYRYDSEDSVSCYIGDSWDIENIIRDVKGELGKFDYLINNDNNAIYDKNGNEVALEELNESHTRRSTHYVFEDDEKEIDIEKAVKEWIKNCHFYGQDMDKDDALIKYLKGEKDFIPDIFWSNNLFENAHEPVAFFMKYAKNGILIDVLEGVSKLDEFVNICKAAGLKNIRAVSNAKKMLKSDPEKLKSDLNKWGKKYSIDTTWLWELFTTIIGYTHDALVRDKKSHDCFHFKRTDLSANGTDIVVANNVKTDDAWFLNMMKGFIAILEKYKIDFDIISEKDSKDLNKRLDKLFDKASGKNKNKDDEWDD